MLTENSQKIPVSLSASYIVRKDHYLLSEEGLKIIIAAGINVIVTRGFRGQIISAVIPDEVTRTETFNSDPKVRSELESRGIGLVHTELIEAIKYQTGGQFGQTKTKLYFYPEIGILATNQDGINLDSQFWLAEARLYHKTDKLTELSVADVERRNNFETNNPRFYWPVMSKLSGTIVGQHHSMKTERIPIGILKGQNEEVMYVPDGNFVFYTSKGFQQMDFTDTERPVFKAFSIR